MVHTVELGLRKAVLDFGSCDNDARIGIRHGEVASAQIL